MFKIFVANPDKVPSLQVETACPRACPYFPVICGLTVGCVYLLVGLLQAAGTDCWLCVLTCWVLQAAGIRDNLVKNKDKLLGFFENF